VDGTRSDDGAVREGEPVFFRGANRSASTSCELDVTDTKNKELPLGGQLMAVLILWVTWLAALAIVIWRGWKLEGDMRYYDYPFIVYPIVFTYIPFALVVLEVLFLWRVRYVGCRLVVGCLTFVTTGVLLTVGIWALSLPWEVIRE
jgi:hypothetical protein